MQDNPRIYETWMNLTKKKKQTYHVENKGPHAQQLQKAASHHSCWKGQFTILKTIGMQTFTEDHVSIFFIDLFLIILVLFCDASYSVMNPLKIKEMFFDRPLVFLYIRMAHMFQILPGECTFMSRTVCSTVKHEKHFLPRLSS